MNSSAGTVRNSCTDDGSTKKFEPPYISATLSRMLLSSMSEAAPVFEAPVTTPIMFSPSYASSGIPLSFKTSAIILTDGFRICDVFFSASFITVSSDTPHCAARECVTGITFFMFVLSSSMIFGTNFMPNFSCTSASGLL